jgi:pimeloyl-ACP methyl ester carboxylesterase
MNMVLFGRFADLCNGFAQRLQQAEVVELSECGHSAHRDQPDRLIDCVSRFLCRQIMQTKL